MEALALYKSVGIVERLALQAIADYERRVGSLIRLTYADTEEARKYFNMLWEGVKYYIIHNGYSSEDIEDKAHIKRIIDNVYNDYIEKHWKEEV